MQGDKTLISKIPYLSSTKSPVPQVSKCPLCPSRMLGTLQDWGSEKVQSCLVCKVSGKEMIVFLAANMLLFLNFGIVLQAQHRNICKFGKMRLN